MILFLLLQIILGDQSIRELPNEDCKARPSIIHLGEGDEIYYPGAILLNRCAGLCSNETSKVIECIGHVEVIHLQVFSWHRKREEVLEVVNHTACDCGCVHDEGVCYGSQQWNNETCRCTCLVADRVCPEDYQWNPGQCGCECDKICTERKYLNSTSCSCECREKFYKRCMRKGLVIDTDCKCRDQSSAVSSPRGNESVVSSCVILMLVVCIALGVMGCIIRREMK